MNTLNLVAAANVAAIHNESWNLPVSYGRCDDFPCAVAATQPCIDGFGDVVMAFCDEHYASLFRSA